MKGAHKITRRVAKKSVSLLSKTAKKNKYTRRVAQKAKITLKNYLNPSREIYNYHNFYPSTIEYKEQLDSEKDFKHRPLVSIVVPTYNTDPHFLKECIDSVIVQSYPKWELCIADDASPNKEVVAVLKDYSQKDKRVKYTVRKQNGHISEATNSAIGMAKGDFITLLDHDDILWPNALFEVVKAINKNPKVDLIYSDEDKIDSDSQNHSYPFFKPDWSPEFLESCNYITHLATIRTSVVKEVGGLRKGYEGAQDWDLFIRVTENTDQIIHIPKVLYSWRVHEASTASTTDAKPYVYEAQHKLLVDHVKRTGKKGQVVKGVIPQHGYTRYSPDYDQPVSVLLVGQPSNKVAWEKNLAKKSINILTLQDNHLSAEVLSRLPDEGVSVIVNCDELKAPTNDVWLDDLVADAQVDNVGFVGPRIISENNLVYTAGIGIASDGSIQKLLVNTIADDPHYMRGLYGRSRRNVIAVTDDIFAVRTAHLKKYMADVSFKDDNSLLEPSLKMADHNLRTIYNPNVTFTSLNPVKIDAGTQKNNHKDPYMSPNFSTRNAYFEVVEDSIRTSA